MALLGTYGQNLRLSSSALTQDQKRQNGAAGMGVKAGVLAGRQVFFNFISNGMKMTLESEE